MRIPIILLSDGLSENSRLPIHSKILQILKVNVQCSQPKSFNLLKLREIKITNSC